MSREIDDTIETVTVGASRKKQFGQYEPAESNVELEGNPEARPDDMTVAEYVESLQVRAGELAREDILRKYNAYVKREIESENEDNEDE